MPVPTAWGNRVGTPRDTEKVNSTKISRRSEQCGSGKGGGEIMLKREYT